jgi:hypothetical protein
MPTLQSGRKQGSWQLQYSYQLRGSEAGPQIKGTLVSFSTRSTKCDLLCRMPGIL